MAKDKMYTCKCGELGEGRVGPTTTTTTINHHEDLEEKGVQATHI